MKGEKFAMYNIEEKTLILNNFLADADQEVERAKCFGDVAELMKEGRDSAARSQVKYLYTSIGSAAKRVRKDIPKMTVYVTMSGESEEITMLKVTITNKDYPDGKLVFKRLISASEDVNGTLVDFFKSVYAQVLEDMLMRENVEKANKILAKITESAGLKFSVAVTTPLAYNGQKIAKITDEEVIFVVDSERIFKMGELVIFDEENEFFEEIMKGEISVFEQATSTPKFVGLKDHVIGYLCDISARVKPATLIRKAYSTNYDHLNKSEGDKRKKTEGYAYVKDGDIFSVKEFSEEGETVVLSPFDLNTLDYVQ